MVNDQPDNVESFDVAVVGAGPIGLEMAAELKRAGVDYVQFEAHQIGHTFTWWPPHTQFFSSPEFVSIAGIPIHTVDQMKLTREAYLAYLRSVVEQLDLKVNLYERVERAERADEGFILHTSTRLGRRTYRCRRVVLASGGMAAPNRLGIPGEDLPHVSHYLAEPHQYFRTRLVVVGGMNSALETALRCWRAGAKVTISYRRAELGRGAAKRHLRAEVMMWIRKGEIEFLPETVPVQITPEHVVLAPARVVEPAESDLVPLPADFVILSTGFVADMSLAEQLGVTLHGPEKVPEHSPATMETDSPGVYLAGTAAGGTQRQYKLFIENGHAHVQKILAALRVIDSPSRQN
ncbi:MAG: NAD(P)-binding domain-containing protein [Planctomycetota bacterium]|jgi:thioredoxin reductase (NADPH)